MIKQAKISKDGRYRYVLRRIWNKDVRRMLFVCVNPSTADDVDDDPTVRRCIAFAAREGWGGIGIVNLFALRNPSPRDMKLDPDPVGPGNDQWIMREALHSGVVVAAWGAHGLHNGRGYEVWKLLKRVGAVFCYGVNKTLTPKHPLYIPDNSPLRPYRMFAQDETEIGIVYGGAQTARRR